MSTQKNIKISHFYTFPHNIEQVFSVFSNVSTFTNVVYKKFVSEFKFEHGTLLDELNTTFSLIWKNYYKITFICTSSINKPHMKAITHKALNLSEITNGTFQCTYRFYWNSCELKTVFQYEFIFHDQMLIDLFKDELSINEMNFMCGEVEKYIKTAASFEQIESAMINSSISSVWNWVCDLENILIFLYTNSPYKLESGSSSKKMQIGKKMSIIKEINGEDIVFAFMVVKEISMSEDRRELSIECTFKEKDTDNIKNKIPKQVINVKIKKINEKSSLIVFSHITNEYINEEKINELGLIKKKILANIKTALESNNSNHNTNSKNSNNNSVISSNNSYSNQNI